MAYKPKYRRKNPKGGWIFDLAAALFFGLLLLGGGMFLRTRLQSRQDQAAFQQLQALVEEQTEPVPGPASAAEEAPSGAESTTPYQVLHDQNPDFAAWLTVPGTGIDYPVMHTPEDIEHYIYRSFDGSDSPSGTPFVGDYGSLEENRCVIYGHNMSDGTMFHDLPKYQEKSFWQKNPSFTITTVWEVREYEIFAAVRTQVLTPEQEGLRYYRLEDGVEEWLMEHALYDTGITAQAGDEIVILSTCTYHADDGRFLIAGRRKV